MIYSVIIGISSFVVGFIVSYFVFKNKNKDFALYSILNEFKNSIDEYKNQTLLNTKEINNAIQTASNLTKILTTNQNLKGKFGEDCLEAVIKTCYPQENINYIKQYITQNTDNKEIKPDYLIKLPNNKSILIDCKLNLEKYIEYKENPNLKAEFMRDLNTTINNLANKKYESALDIQTCDFILMYIPLEPVLTLIYTDKDFLGVIKNANDKNIIIVGNSSILTTIRLTKLLWAQNTQDKNIQNIISLAQNIYDMVSEHSQNLYNMKLSMEENLKLFNKEYAKFSNETKFFKTVEQLKNFGIMPSAKKSGRKSVESVINSDFLN